MPKYIQTFKLKVSYKDGQGKKHRQTVVINCWSEGTRYGFRHIASCGFHQFKCCYYNRTWERFQFESVLIIVLKWLEENSNNGMKIRSYEKFLDKNLIRIN